MAMQYNPLVKMGFDKVGITNGAELGFYYSHSQVVPSTNWVVNHNAGQKYMNTILLDGSGNQFYADILYTSVNTLNVITGIASTGTAIVIN